MAAQGMDQEMEEVKSEIAATRAQMADTLASLEARVSGTMESVQRKVNPLELARAHPWPALAVAVGAGVALSASGADRKAAAATVEAGRRAPGATARAAKRASHKAGDLAQHALPGGRSEGAPYDTMAQNGGPFSRLTRGLRESVDARLADMVQELWRSSTGVTLSAAPRSTPPAG
jgi:ElaB/YqjD/DUF883 family membrane-anchored ribosome-binding protein